jgi:hypothetical protein
MTYIKPSGPQAAIVVEAEDLAVGPREVLRLHQAAQGPLGGHRPIPELGQGNPFKAAEFELVNPAGNAMFVAEKSVRKYLLKPPCPGHSGGRALNSPSPPSGPTQWRFQGYAAYFTADCR